MLFSNKPKMVRKAKYVLDKNHRVHLGSRDPAYKCIWYGPDAEGNNGIYLGKDVVNEASRALSIAMRKVAPSILTTSQIAKYALTEIQRKLSSGKVAPYKPVFTECLEHFLIHAGGLYSTAESNLIALQRATQEKISATGRVTGLFCLLVCLKRHHCSAALPVVYTDFSRCLLTGQTWSVGVGGAKVLDGIGKELQLDEKALEASRAVLFDYGNVSSSTTWYTLGYVESVLGAKKGDRLLQIGVGSGIKCGVNVWRAVRDIHDVQVSLLAGQTDV